MWFTVPLCEFGSCVGSPHSVSVNQRVRNAHFHTRKKKTKLIYIYLQHGVGIKSQTVGTESCNVTYKLM